MGVEGEDIEAILLEQDEAFWRELNRRRRVSRTVSLAEARAQLGATTRRSR